MINQEKQTKRIWKTCQENDNSTIGNLLDYLCHQSYYELIGIDLSRQTYTSIPQQINFIGKLEEDHGAEQCFLLLKSNKKLF